MNRLFDDLRQGAFEVEEAAPAALRSRLFHRIDCEPARVQTDLDGHILATNPAFSAMCGYAYHEIAGRKPSTFLQGPLTEPDEVAKIRSAIRARMPVTAELTNYHKNGSTYRVRIDIEPTRGEDGQVVGFSAIESKLS